MSRTRRGTAKRFAALSAVALALALLPSAAAAPVAGRLHLTNDLLAPPDRTGGTGTKTFAMTGTPPTGSDAQKAYLGTSAGMVTWDNAFEYAAPVALLVEGQFTAKMVVSCDKAAVYRPVVPDHLGNSAVSLLVDGRFLAGATREDQAAACSGPTDVKQLDYGLDVPRTTVAAGSILTLRFSIYWSNTDDSVAENGFLVTGVADGASFLEGAGLPVDGANAPAPDGNAFGGPGNATSAPGSQTAGGLPGGDGGAAGTPEHGAPGFGAILAVAAIASLALLRRRNV